MEKVLKVDFSGLGDGVYFLCPECGKASEYVREDGDVSYFGKRYLSGKLEYDLEDLGEERPYTFFCPSCGRKFYYKDCNPLDFAIEIKNGKVVKAGKHWAEELNVERL